MFRGSLQVEWCAVPTESQERNTCYPQDCP